MNNLPELFSIYIKDGAIILEPVREVPKDERWFFEHENKEFLKQVKEGLKQKGSIDLGSFKDYLKE